ncbi:hypothetical protein [Prosthecobacter sp.]|uniref:hypothetical protein n=1 Tax=Prosthecobacter sp. TaxID=1965333 RepID=UPI003783D7FB
MNASHESWENRSYNDLFEEAVALELRESDGSTSAAPDVGGGMRSFMGPVQALPGLLMVEQARERVARLVSTCLLVGQSTYEAFVQRCRRLPLMKQARSPNLDPLLQAAWVARKEIAEGTRTLTTAEAQTAARGQALQSLLAADTTSSWAYEGLAVSMKAG